jgi:hypothetical protein
VGGSTVKKRKDGEMSTSKRVQEALERVYGRIKDEISFYWNKSTIETKLFELIEEEYQKEGGDINDLPGIK